MKRAISVQSHVEGDALVRVLDVPVLKSVQTITGLLLEHEDDVRAVVLELVQTSLSLADSDRRSRITGTLPGRPVAALATNYAGTSGE